MLKSCIGYGISVNWEKTPFPAALFDDLGEKAQQELLEDHLDDYDTSYRTPQGKDVVRLFDPCAAYACLVANVLTRYPLLDVSTPGFYNNDDNPAAVIYTKGSLQTTTGNTVSLLPPVQSTHGELDEIKRFCETYFPETTILPIFWAELS